jgi:hypothetical protein
VIFRSLAHLKFLQAVVPPSVVKELLFPFFALLGPQKTQGEAPKLTNNRIIMGETFGRELEPSTTGGPPAVPRETCPHPASQLRRRGNKAATDKEQAAAWWTCLDCKGRWARIKYLAQAVPRGEEMMMIGKHTGKSFQEVYDNHRDYVEWAMQTAEETNENCHPNLAALARYTTARLQKEGADQRRREEQEEENIHMPTGSTDESDKDSEMSEDWVQG